MLGHKSFRFRNGFFYGQSVEGETIKRSGTSTGELQTTPSFASKLSSLTSAPSMRGNDGEVGNDGQKHSRDYREPALP